LGRWVSPDAYLKILSGRNPKADIQAHHVFPKEFADKFELLGINVHDPRFGAWVGAKTHLTDVHGIGKYNEEWRRFFDTPSTSGAFQKAQELGVRHGFEFNF
jgi:hypothetical protein